MCCILVTYSLSSSPTHHQTAAAAPPPTRARSAAAWRVGVATMTTDAADPEVPGQPRRRIICWLRNDLRLRDNAVLHAAGE
jgi:hypothetical protein